MTTSGGQPAVVVDDLVFRYPRATEVAIKGVSFEFAPGQIHGIVGHNGAGKTTLFLLLAGLWQPKSGQIAVLGHRPDDPEIRQRVGIVTDKLKPNPRFTVRQTCRIFARLYGLHNPNDVADRSIEAYGLGDHASVKVKALSTGLRKRLLLAISTMHEPQLLLLDEPFSGLDPLALEDVLQSIRDWATAGHTVVIASHDLPELDRIADTITLLNQGEVLVTEPIEALRKRFTQNIGTVTIHCTSGHQIDVPMDAEKLETAFRELRIRGESVLRLGVEDLTLTDIYARLLR